ncbi:MAG: DNA-binding response regulator [Phycisphaeraceae bacterium]|nr:DNA-binding response regulator [Phycisphaerales bacterium]MCB9843610.1 DNA-binding response regulator [Phycisphaeraceae bacterium]
MSGVQSKRSTVLILDDEPRFRGFLVQVLPDMGCDPLPAGTAREASAILEKHTPDILMLDLNLPHTDGMSFLREFRKSHELVPTIILTGFGDLSSAQQAIELGVISFLTKPCHLGEIEVAIDRARRQIERTCSLARTPNSLEGPSQELTRPLAELERESIIDALRRNGGNRTATATQLGISRRALYNKIEQLRRDGVSPI